jgi:pyruvate,orthophosphate dikinase
MNKTHDISIGGSAAQSLPVETPQVINLANAFNEFSGDRETLKAVLGGKGAGIAEMIVTGGPVPPAFTITTTTCQAFYENQQQLPKGLMNEVFDQIARLQHETQRTFGGLRNPLLLSVRSGAKFSMPGMMDTILNLGLNHATAKALILETRNPRFVWDSYRRLVQMYGNVVFGIPKEIFEHCIYDARKRQQVRHDDELSEAMLEELVLQFRAIIAEESDFEFPEDPEIQLRGAIEAVFRSWQNPRAKFYREMHRINHNLGTAVTIQAMVFGNLNQRSATGVCFSRNPGNGIKELYGEFLMNAQGEDVVAGTRTPHHISELKTLLPEAFELLNSSVAALENYYKDMQDIEFTIEDGKLYLLQTRTGKRTAAAAVKIAVDLVRENAIDQRTAIKRVDPMILSQLLLPAFNESDLLKARKDGRLVTCGLKASPGAATGEAVFCPNEAETRARQGTPVILIRVETCPDDLHGIVAAQGVVTSRGGMTSHAAVVARGIGKPCVAGCDELLVDLKKELAVVKGPGKKEKIIRKGDIISIDGGTGELFMDTIRTEQPEFSRELEILLSWADEIRQLRVRANADTPADAILARKHGAQGIGLCRTEHMFMDPERLPLVQKMIMSDSKEERVHYLKQLRPMQERDFVAIFRAMKDFPVTIRLLDPPLHEFLPREELLREEITAALDSGNNRRAQEYQQILSRVQALREVNPMLGFRGCRLGLVYPEIYQMQVAAIISAALRLEIEGIIVIPEIMIPLVGDAKEIEILRALLAETAQEEFEKAGVVVPFQFGTMMEVPRACLTADQIVHHADFFSFGTNDLTQLTYGYSRDDAEATFLQKYLEGINIGGNIHKVLDDNPFEKLDRSGVGRLMKIAVNEGRKVKPDLKIGICGEHGGEPSAVMFAHSVQVSYVSCSPFRVPISRLAAAQAVLKERRDGSSS